jgi:hypothetical protein
MTLPLNSLLRPLKDFFGSGVVRGNQVAISGIRGKSVNAGEASLHGSVNAGEGVLLHEKLLLPANL